MYVWRFCFVPNTIFKIQRIHSLCLGELLLTEERENVAYEIVIMCVPFFVREAHTA